MSPGELVEVIVTPYKYSVPVGTRATLETVILNHFHPKSSHPSAHLYVLSGLSHRLFRYHELRTVLE